MDSSRFKVAEISEETLMEIWKNHLWKDRQDPIRYMSSMKFAGGYDLHIYYNYRPSFLGLFYESQLVGCNSCHRTSETQMRSRGLFIFPEYRGRDGSQLLFAAVEEKAREQNCSWIWSYPKHEALNVYLKFGFTVDRPSDLSPRHSYVLKPVSRS
jgi:GNAT superfamily N-acetyltransferase